MKTEFNYNNPYFYFLSLFSVILILSLSDIISSEFALHYSILGITICVIVWVVDSYYYYEIEIMQNSDNEFGISDKLEQRIQLQGVLIISLLLIFVILSFI